MQYGLSDVGLSLEDVQVYNAGGPEFGVTVVCPGCIPSPPTTYGNPLQLFGPLIQFPLAIDPVAIVYDPTYEKIRNSDGSITSYHFNNQFPRSDGSGGLRLDATTYCKIFNGQITNWNDPSLTALNHGLSLEDPADPTPAASWSVPLQIVGDSAASGTTAIFYRHLATVCVSLAGNQYIGARDVTLPAFLQGPNYNKLNPNYPAPPGEALGKFTLAEDDDGVAIYTAFSAAPANLNTSIIQGRMAYLSPSYALPYVLNNGVNEYGLTLGLNTATLKNSLSQWEAPTPAAASRAYLMIPNPPQTDSSGNFCGCGTKLRSNPQDWVEPNDNSSVLSNPVVSHVYPIVGTTNFIGYTCYATASSTTAIVGQLGYIDNQSINTDTTNGILAEAGMSPLPKTWRTAITRTFLSNYDGLGLNFATAGTAGLCSVSGVVGG